MVKSSLPAEEIYTLESVDVETYRDQYNLFTRKVFDNAGRSYTLRLFKGDIDDLNGVEKVVNDSSVYPTIRHGGKWDLKLVLKRANAYAQGNSKVLKALFEGNYKWAPDFTCVWVLLDDEAQTIVGRGGFQDAEVTVNGDLEDGSLKKFVKPNEEGKDTLFLTEIFFTTTSQRKTLGSQVGDLLEEFWSMLFGESRLPLLGLYLNEGNKGSEAILGKLGFTPLIMGAKQAVVEEWGRSYNILIRHF